MIKEGGEGSGEGWWTDIGLKKGVTSVRHSALEYAKESALFF